MWGKEKLSYVQWLIQGPCISVHATGTMMDAVPVMQEQGLSWKVGERIQQRWTKNIFRYF